MGDIILTPMSAAQRQWAVPKANPNSWCQEIRKLLGQQEIRESARKWPGNYLNSAGNLVYLRLRCSGEPQKEKKITNFFSFDFFFWKSQEKSRFWFIYGKTVYYYQEFTRKLLESHPESGSGNYLEGTGNSGLPCFGFPQHYVASSFGRGGAKMASKSSVRPFCY